MYSVHVPIYNLIHTSLTKESCVSFMAAALQRLCTVSVLTSWQHLTVSTDFSSPA